MRTMMAMVDALLPMEPGIDAEERRRIVAAASTVIEARVGGLPAVFRLGIHLLLRVFEMLALIFLFGRFSQATQEKRRRFLDRAETWHALHLDDLIRLVRSLALLVYYDDHAVRRQIGFSP